LVRIAQIEAGSIAEELELEIGTRIIRINGQKVRDGIDLTFLLADPELEIETVDPSGDSVVYEVELEPGESLGLVPAPDTIRECANKCVFCFIDGNPQGVRQSLWLRDDDFRLSFAYGSYVTLTNLGPKGLQRLVDQRISPLYVSVHATEPEVRRRLLVNERAGLIMDQLRFLLDGGLDGGSADPGLLRRIRVVGATSLVMAGVGAPYVLLNAVYVSPALGLQIALCLGAAMVNLWVLRRTLDTVACGHIGTAILFTAIVSLCLQSGGFDTPSASWLYLIPLTAAVLINARAGLVWCGICALTTTVFWGSDWLGLPVLNRIDEEVRHGYYLLSRLSALGALSALAAVFALMQRRLEETLVRAGDFGAAVAWAALRGEAGPIPIF